ncbi:MAG: site-2 protease family protein, partial [Caulobacteraceae bacterium]|nr:site-2 protease family protein [Caulobacteraceae bacterium]
GGLLGLYSGPTAEDLKPRRRGPLQALAGGVGMTWDVLDGTLETIWGIVTGQISPNELGGPIGIAQASHAVVASGAAAGRNLGQKLEGGLVGLLGLCGVVSVGIGFMNLMPIPILDGGHLLFYAYEAVARRPLDAAVQALSYRVGLALLLGLMLFATTNDLQRGRVFHFLGGLFS